MELNKEPLIPSSKPDNMSFDEFHEQVIEATKAHDQWVYENLSNLQKQTEEQMWYHILNEEKERLSSDNLYKDTNLYDEF